MIKFIASLVRFSCKITFVLAGALIPAHPHMILGFVAVMCMCTFAFLIVGNPNKRSD